MSTTRPQVHDDRSGSAEASRRGAHRARAKPLSAGLPVLAGVLVIFLVAGVAYLVLGQRGDAKDSGAGLEAAAAPESTASITAQAPPQPSAAASAAASAGGSEAGQQTQTKKRTTAAGGAVNRDVELAVLNGTSVQGLAKQVATRIGQSGWTVGRTGNPKQKGAATTKVYYGSGGSAATATALVKDLGYGTAVQDSAVVRTGEVGTTGMVVVLGADAR